MDSREVTVNATMDQLLEFKESILWQDIIRELNMWREGFQYEQDSIVDDAAETNPSTASVLMHLGDINGRKKAIDYLLAIPDVFITILEDKKNVSGRDEAK